MLRIFLIGENIALWALKSILIFYDIRHHLASIKQIVSLFTINLTFDLQRIWPKNIRFWSICKTPINMKLIIIFLNLMVFIWEGLNKAFAFRPVHPFTFFDFCWGFRTEPAKVSVCDIHAGSASGGILIAQTLSPKMDQLQSLLGSLQ